MIRNFDTNLLLTIIGLTFLIIIMHIYKNEYFKRKLKKLERKWVEDNTKPYGYDEWVCLEKSDKHLGFGDELECARISAQKKGILL